MNNNLRLVVNNVNDKKLEDKHFFEKDELKIILDLYAKMVSEKLLKSGIPIGPPFLYPRLAINRHLQILYKDQDHSNLHPMQFGIIQVVVDMCFVFVEALLEHLLIDC